MDALQGQAQRWLVATKWTVYRHIAVAIQHGNGHFSPVKHVQQQTSYATGMYDIYLCALSNCFNVHLEVYHDIFPNNQWFRYSNMDIV